MYVMWQLPPKLILYACSLRFAFDRYYFELPNSGSITRQFLKLIKLLIKIAHTQSRAPISHKYYTKTEYKLELHQNWTVWFNISFRDHFSLFNNQNAPVTVGYELKWFTLNIDFRSLFIRKCVGTSYIHGMVVTSILEDQQLGFLSFRLAWSTKCLNMLVTKSGSCLE